jgi:hypothetical protein
VSGRGEVRRREGIVEGVGGEETEGEGSGV